MTGYETQHQLTTINYPLSIKPFIRRIEGGNRHVEHAQPADCPVPAERLDENRVSRPHGVPLAIQLDLSLAFEDVIHLRHPLVIVNSRVDRNIHYVKRCHLLRLVDKRPPRLAAGAFNRRQVDRTRDAITSRHYHCTLKSTVLNDFNQCIQPDTEDSTSILSEHQSLQDRSDLQSILVQLRDLAPRPLLHFGIPAV